MNSIRCNAKLRVRKDEKQHTIQCRLPLSFALELSWFSHRLESIAKKVLRQVHCTNRFTER